MKISSKLNELKQSDLNCNVFDVYSYEGLTMQELLCQFFTKINECIKVSNETIDLASWLVNEGLKIEVVDKLMLWLEDGTLENVINEDLFSTLNSKIEYITETKGYKTPEEFGAIGDGVNDDSIALKESIIYCANNNYTLMLKGRYRIATSIELQMVNSVTIIGNKGNYRSLIADIENINNEAFDIFLDNGAIIEINKFGSITFQNVGFSSTSKESKSSIILKSFHNKFVNCSFSQFEKAISMLSGATNWLGENQILYSGFYKCTYGIYTEDGSDSEVIGCLFHGTCDFGFWGNCAGYTFSNNHFYARQGNKFIAFNTKITNNYIQETTNNNPAITIEPRFGILISNNNFELNSTGTRDEVKGLIGIEMLNGKGNITITGNSVHGKDMSTVENLSFIYLIGDTNYDMPFTLGVNNIRCCEALFNIKYPLYNLLGTLTLSKYEPTKLGGEFTTVSSKVINSVCHFYVDMTPPNYANFLKISTWDSNIPYVICVEETLKDGTVKTYNKIMDSSTISFSNYSQIKSVKIKGSYLIDESKEPSYYIE